MSIPVRRSTLVVAYVLFSLFIAMRFYKLADRPMHNDESVNAFFLQNLIKHNNYKYDPENYHGPILYYLQLIPTWLSTLSQKGLDFSFSSIDGVTESSVRWAVVGASLLLLLALFGSAHRLGEWGTIAALAFMGFSCDFLYYGRYFIHEIYFVLFTFGIYWGLTTYLDSGKQVGLRVAILSVMLLYATKETSVVTYFVMALSFVCVESFAALRDGLGIGFAFTEIRKRCRTLLSDVRHHQLSTLFVAFLIWLLLYTSFFKNPHGLIDSVMTYLKWTKEGVDSGHNKSFGYFITKVIWPSEMGITIAAVIGGVLALVRNDRRGLYLASWSTGIVLAYSIIPYKTVWCVLNLLLPMILLAGWGVQQLFLLIQTIPNAGRRSVGFGLLFIGTAGLILCQLPATLKTVYREFDSETHVQAYVHTVRDIYALVQRIEMLSRLSRLEKAMTVNFVSTEYWPIPFYLRHYSSVNFWGTYKRVPDLDTYVIVSDPSQDEALKSILKDPYITEEYLLRASRPLHMHINTKYFKIEPPAEIPSVFKAVSVPENLKAGLEKTVWSGRRFVGPVLAHKEGVADFKFDIASNAPSPFPVPFCIQWDGYIRINEASAQTWVLGSDDGSQIFIDDILVINNDNVHNFEEKRGTINFDAGLHKIRLRYFDAGGFKELKWARLDSNGTQEPIPMEQLFHSDSDSERQK